MIRKNRIGRKSKKKMVKNKQLLQKYLTLYTKNKQGRYNMCNNNNNKQ